MLQTIFGDNLMLFTVFKKYLLGIA